MWKLRQEVQNARKIVVKIGSASLTNTSGGINYQKIDMLAEELVELIKSNRQVVLVSSGAISTGRSLLKNHQGEDISQLQLLSSIGQPHLISRYEKTFSAHHLHVAQFLLTHEDFKSRKRFLNARNTLLLALEKGIVPILNENDCVSFDEITVGDNDHLAAMVASMLEVDLVLFLSSTDGLLDTKKNLVASVLPQDDLKQFEIFAKTTVGRGGMGSKLKAIDKLRPLGIASIISNANIDHPVKTALTEVAGTYFAAATKVSGENRKAWLMSTQRVESKIFVDEGAAKALKKKSSLLPIGIKKLSGIFLRGDSVGIYFEDELIAVGLVEYTAGEVERIKGKKSTEIEAILGVCISTEVIHKDNLVLKENLCV